MKNNFIDTGIPLGGIGTGGVELRADGKFHEWQIYNNQPWGSALPLPEVSAEDAFFSIRYKEGDNTPGIKISAVLDGSPISLTGEVKEKKCTINLQNEINLKEGSNLEIGLVW